jgi:SAM-dependent methyltransferase
MAKLASLIPNWVGTLARSVKHYGGAHYCPCCDKNLRKFSPYGLVQRENAMCAICGSLERHRLIWLFFLNQTDLFDGSKKSMLHVAPELQFYRHFQAKKYINYLSADLDSPIAMEKMDITKIQHPDESFDVIYCSHVLEHVPDDRKAMREFHRTLKSGGWAILQVPITADVTYEDPSIVSPKERELAFGQHDHVRRYGPDYKNRLEEAGFDVNVVDYFQEFSPAEIEKMGLVKEEIYFCRK